MNALAAIAAATASSACRSPAVVAALETVDARRALAHAAAGGRDGVTVINDAYNASPDSMAAALQDARADRRRPAQRTVAVLGEMSELGEYAERGARPDRAARRAPRHPAARRRGPGRAPHAPRGRSTRARGTASRSSSRPPTRRTTYLVGELRARRPRAREVVELGGSALPRRSSGRIVLVRALLTAGGVLAGLHAVPHARSSSGCSAARLGPVHPRRRAAEPPRQARHAHHGRHDLHPRHDRRLPRRRATSANEPPTISAMLVLWHDGRPRRRRLHRRLPEDPQAAQPRPRRLGEDRRPGPRRRRRSRSLALQLPERRGRDARVDTSISVFRDVPLLTSWRSAPIVGWHPLRDLDLRSSASRASNGVNVTDGLDGLAAGAAIFAIGAYILIGFWQFNQSCFSENLDPSDAYTLLRRARPARPRDRRGRDRRRASSGSSGGTRTPAHIFMGDTGSLALGGALAALAILSRTELLAASSSAASSSSRPARSSCSGCTSSSRAASASS